MRKCIVPRPCPGRAPAVPRGELSPCGWTHKISALTDDDKIVRHEFCKTWLRQYSKAELKRTFDNCIFLDECWIPAFPVTRFVRYRRGHKPVQGWYLAQGGARVLRT
eukprot:gene10016-biopygen7408